MIQHHLVYFYTAMEEGGVTYYSVNMQAAYYLGRSGKILEFVEDRLGQYAATVLSTIMYFGHAQVSHLDTLPELRPETLKPNGIQEDGEALQDEEKVANGIKGEHTSEEPALLHPTLKALAGHGYIIRVREAHFQSYVDNVLNIERQVRLGDAVQNMKGKKMDEYILEKTAEMLREKLDGDLTHGLIVNGVPRGVKRGHASGTPDDDANRKKGRFDYDDEEQEESEWWDDEVPMEVLLQICPLFSGLARLTIESQVFIDRPSQLREVRRCPSESAIP